MKKNTCYYLSTVVISLFMVLSLTGCREDGPDLVSPSMSVPPSNGPAQYKIPENFDVVPETVILFAGQTIQAGTISVDLVEDGVGAYAVTVTYTTVGFWELTEAHVWVGTDRAEMPQTRTGNPKIGKFPYQSGDITGSSSYTFYVPLRLSEAACDTAPDYVIAAHAALRKSNGDGTYQTETGWGDGEPIVDKGSWATFFTVDIVCDRDDDDDGGNGTETAFAFGENFAVCFLDIDEDGDGNRDFNRWGWSNGPLRPGSYSFPIYAGAGHCDVTKGTLVGTLIVDVDGSTAVVSYQMEEPYTLQETHLFVGHELLARDENGVFTVAPGQYPESHEGLDGAISDSYTITGVSGDIYIVAHATVYAVTSQ